MKFAEVSETDMRLFAQLINMLQVGEFKVNGKDVCAAADAIRWLQKAAVSAADCYANSKASAKESVKEPEAVAVAPSDTPKAGLPEGVAVKAFNPGKIGKSK